MAITYFRCTNLDENTAKIILYDKDGKIIPVEKDVSGETQVDFNLSELITEEGIYNLYVKAYPAADSTEYLESPASESKEYIVGSSGDNESGGTAPDEPEEDETTKYTFTIKPSLSDTTDTTTTVTITLEADGYEKVTGTGSQSIEVVSGTIVKYTASATGYITQTGEYTVTKNEEYSVELILENSFPAEEFEIINPNIISNAELSFDGDYISSPSYNTDIYEFTLPCSKISNSKFNYQGWFEMTTPKVNQGECIVAKIAASGGNATTQVEPLTTEELSYSVWTFQYYEITDTIDFCYNMVRVQVPSGTVVQGSYAEMEEVVS